MTPATLLTPATTVMPPTAVTPTTPMMPVEAGTPTAANDFSGNSQKIFKLQLLIPLILSTYNRNSHISLKNSQITIFYKTLNLKKFNKFNRR
jgi:hypothetical protein